MDTDDQDRAPAVLTGLRGRGYRSTTILGALEIAVPSARAGELEALRHRVERLERELGECQRRQSAMAAALVMLLDGVETMAARLRQPGAPR